MLLTKGNRNPTGEIMTGPGLFFSGQDFPNPTMIPASDGLAAMLVIGSLC